MNCTLRGRRPADLTGEERVLSTRRMVLWLSTLLAVGCAAPQPTPSDVAGPLVWGGADGVMQIGRVYIAGQPDVAGLAAAREAGVTTVVTLRESGEIDWDEEGAARSLGLDYVRIPVERQSDSLSSAAVAQLDRVLADSGDDPILLHCSSGNRAAALYAAWLAERRGMSPDDAVAIGRRAGITRDFVETRVRNYLDEL